MPSWRPKKDMVFDWDRALDFEGQAAPYIQYAHVRAGSILQRAGQVPAPLVIEHELSASEIQLLDRISRFPDEAQRAAGESKPMLTIWRAISASSTNIALC